MAGTATGMEVVIEGLPLEPRDDAMLVTAAYPLQARLEGVPYADRWPAGLKFRARGCRDLKRMGQGWCNPPNYDDANSSDTADETFQSFLVYGDDQCSTRVVTPAWLRERIDMRMAAMESAQLANELLSGSATGNPSLSSSATVPSGITTGLTVPEALRAAEIALAESLHGAKGMLHMSPGVFAIAQSGGGLNEDEATEEWETPTGHRIVADAGYDPAVTPASPGGVTGATEWIYTSAPVFWIMSEVRYLGVPDESGLDIVHDTQTLRAVKDALVVFDPCATNAIPVA